MCLINLCATQVRLISVDFGRDGLVTHARWKSVVSILALVAHLILGVGKTDKLATNEVLWPNKISLSGDFYLCFVISS